MLINFCTLFDSNYSARGLAMYESLVRHCPSFHLFIFAFDDILASALKKMSLKDVTVITLSEFEDDELLAVKSTRTPGEYCWTCSGSTILYCLKHFDLDSCTYIDADLYFYADPSVLIDEMGDDDIMITEHRYTPQYDQSKTSGRYCVQFMTFKNNSNGLRVLQWWRNACLEWCYNRSEDGKFGDQKYLDDWTTRFQGVHELQHLGGGVGPWNMQQYEFKEVEKRLAGIEMKSGNEFPVIFFHFHNVKCYSKGWLREFYITQYMLPSSARKYLYNAYIPHIKKCYYKMRNIDKNINGLAMKPLEDRWSLVCKRVIKMLFVSENHFYHWLEWK